MEKKKVSSRAAICSLLHSGGLQLRFLYRLRLHTVLCRHPDRHGFTNTQLGLLLTVLGIASTILYLPGGFLADKFDPLKLMTIGLIGAGAVGFFIAQFPSYPIMMALYVIWPVFAILIAWNPQIKVLAPHQ